MTHPTSNTHRIDNKRRRYDKSAAMVIRLGGISVLLTLVLMILYLITVIFPLFYSGEIDFQHIWHKVHYDDYPSAQYVWQSTSTDVSSAKLSLMPTLFGTFKAALVAMFFAIPLAVGSAIYTAYFMAPLMRRYVKPCIEMIEVLPTVVIGVVAALWLAPWIERHLLSLGLFLIILPVVFFIFTLGVVYLGSVSFKTKIQGWGGLLFIPGVIGGAYLSVQLSTFIEQEYFQGSIHYWLAEQGIDMTQRNTLIAGLAIGFAVIPTIFTLTEEAISAVPRHLSLAASALGATRWQTFRSLILVSALPGIIAAIMVGLSRAIGETMIVLMATNNTPIMDWNLLEGMRSLTANIAIEMPESEVGSVHFRLLFLSAFLLLIFTFIFNSIAEWVRYQLRSKYHAW